MNNTDFMKDFFSTGKVTLRTTLNCNKEGTTTNPDGSSVEATAYKLADVQFSSTQINTFARSSSVTKTEIGSRVMPDKSTVRFYAEKSNGILSIKVEREVPRVKFKASPALATSGTDAKEFAVVHKLTLDGQEIFIRRFQKTPEIGKDIISPQKDALESSAIDF
ncbi:MAG: hypothetical protein RL023_261 [Candidatus Parcubacteria bacterium]